MSTQSGSEICIVVEELTPRIRYTMAFVMEQCFALPYRLILWTDPELHSSVDSSSTPLNYTRKAIPGYHTLPCNGLLYENDIWEDHRSIVISPNIPDEKGELSPGSRDDFAAIFINLSDYRHYCPSSGERDAHGRYPDLHGNREVHEALANLRELVQWACPKAAPPRKSSFSYEITIDFDQIWKYQHKPLHVKLGGGIKDLLRGKPDELRDRSRSILGSDDPYDVFDAIHELCPPEKTSLFFLVDGDHDHDSRFSLKMPAYQDLVKQYAKAGYSIGLHPSYESRDDKAMLKQQKDLLEAVTGPVLISRQHFLRYSLPDTFRHLEDMGIQKDYSRCMKRGFGLPTAYAGTYPWFDLAADRATELLMVPATIMDRGLLHQNLSPTEAWKKIRLWIDKVRAVEGHFVIILHNETFSDSGEWKGWLQVIRDMMEYLENVAAGEAGQ